MANNFLNPSVSYGNVNEVYGHSIMPTSYPMSGTRYDINLAGMQNCDIPAVLVIDSRDRNSDVYPDPNKYTIKLDPPYKQVTSVELVTADIPNSGYVIEESHNLIYFQETAAQVSAGTYTTAEVPVGNRSISNIADQIASVMTAASTTGSTYTCTVNDYTNLVTITQSVAGTASVFNLLFEGLRTKTDPPSFKDSNGDYCGAYKTLYKTRSIGPIIGFKREDYSGSTTYTGTYAYNLKVDKYIIIYINKSHGEMDFGRIDAVNDNVKGSFCVVPLDSSVNNFEYAKNYNTCDNDRYIKYFTQPVPEINQLDIEFRDSEGNLFNFNGHDHTLIFQFTSNTRQRQFVEPDLLKPVKSKRKHH